MLVLTLHPSNQIRIGKDIVIRLAPGLNQARIGIEAPREVDIVRETNNLNKANNHVNSR